MSETVTIASYLKTRLEQLGLGAMFGVAGNYTAGFLDTILADPDSSIRISTNANEICAGYAADAYARYNGIGALYVTYSVGAFSLLNTIAGSYVEQVPVLLINGGPTSKEASLEQNAGLLYSHTTGLASVDIGIFRSITAAAEQISNSAQAPYQIDSALTAMITELRPAYIEIAEDLWRAECQAPQGELFADRPGSVTRSEVDAAVEATVELIQGSSKALFWAGIELARYRLQDDFLELLETVNGRHTSHNDQIRFITTALSKSVISEDNPYFDGCVTLKKAEIDTLLGDDGILIGIGGWTVGKDTGNENIRSNRAVLSYQGGILVGAKYYPSVLLEDFLKGLIEKLKSIPAQNLAALRVTSKAPRLPLTLESNSSEKLGYDAFFGALDSWITRDHMLVVDAGFPLIGAQSLKIRERGGFLAQAAWLAIGYSVAAGTGVKMANPDKRVVVVVGDGAFHETCQAISDHTADGQNTVVFVLSNGIYGIEQFIVNPNPFREPDDKKDYPDQNLNTVFKYNTLPKWDFVKLAEGFGAKGRKAADHAGLHEVLGEIASDPGGNYLVEIVIPKTDLPGALDSDAKGVGEDEYQNPSWPPCKKF